jgi:hypothetical protein
MWTGLLQDEKGCQGRQALKTRSVSPRELKVPRDLFGKMGVRQLFRAEE